MRNVALMLAFSLSLSTAVQADDRIVLCATYVKQLESAAAGQTFFFTGYDWSSVNLAKSLAHAAK